MMWLCFASQIEFTRTGVLGREAVEIVNSKDGS